MRSLLTYGTIWHARARTGFSLVELLVALSVIATLSIVAYVSVGNIQKNQLNARRVADITALGNAIETMALETKTLPFPTANRAYFSANGAYTHSSSGAFGVTSSLSEDILGKYALSEHPRDPETGVYYRYGLSLAQTGSTLKPSYQIAGVLRDGTNATALVRGTYIATPTIPSLIKGYNSTSFVVDGGTDTLPYNPTERSVTASIVSASGAVSINPTKSLTSLLVLGDELTVGTGGLASIKVSDGTELSLGSPTNMSVLKISELQVKDDRGLFTRVRLILSSGQVGARVPELRVRDGNRSDLEIESGGAVAAVRGTIFGVNAGDGALGTPRYITLLAGSLETQRTDGAPLIATGGSEPALANNIIVVPEGSPAQTITVGGSPTAPTLTPTTSSLGMVQVSALQSQINYTEWLKVYADLEIVGVAFTGSVTSGEGNLTGWVRFKTPHTGKWVRVEGAQLAGTAAATQYLQIDPVYRKSDGKIPDILEGTTNDLPVNPLPYTAVITPNTSSPVAWQSSFAVDRTGSGAIRISVCTSQNDPKTCSLSQAFTLPRISGQRTSVRSTPVLKRIATGTGEFTPVTIEACAAGDKFCEDENLMAYADMINGGNLVSRTPGQIINNMLAYNSTGVCGGGSSTAAGSWSGCIAYTGDSYEDLLAVSKRIEIVYDDVPNSTRLGWLFQMMDDTDAISSWRALNIGELKMATSFSGHDDQYNYLRLWYPFSQDFSNVKITYSTENGGLKIVTSTLWTQPNLTLLGNKINIAASETWSPLTLNRGFRNPIRGIRFYK